MPRADVAVIGGGPAGYAAALRARHRGLSVTLVEDRELGGVCLNRGCIPTKTMLHLVEVVSTCDALAAEGALDGVPQLDYAGAVAHRERIVQTLRGGVHGLLRSAGVDLVVGRGRLRDGVVVVGDVAIDASHVLLATGSSPTRPPIPGADLPGVLDSDGALALETLPDSALIVGGGAVGCEWAAVLHGFGVDVVLVEARDHLLPTEDAAVSKVLEQSLARRGVSVRTGVAIAGIGRAGERLAVAVGDDEEHVDIVVLATGRRPNTADLGLDEHGVVLDDRGFVKTDLTMATSAPQISAVGDVAGGPLLAHAATHEAQVAIDRIAGIDATVDHEHVPSVTYTSPEVASVGRTLDAAGAVDASSRAHVVPFTAIGRAVAASHADGFAQLVTSGPHGRIVGGQIVGPQAGELIGEVALAIELEATLDDLAATVHAHPTHIEILHEAALVGLGLPLHMTRRAPS